MCPPGGSVPVGEGGPHAMAPAPSFLPPLSLTLSHQMGGGSEKTLSDWMVRQGMVRRGRPESAHPRSWPRGRACRPGRTRAPWAPGQPGAAGPTQHSVRSCCPAPGSQRPGAHFRSWLGSKARAPALAAESAWGLPASEQGARRVLSGRGRCCGQPRAPAAAAGATGAARKAAAALLRASCCPWGLGCWRQSLGMELAWLEKDFPSFPN